MIASAMAAATVAAETTWVATMDDLAAAESMVSLFYRFIFNIQILMSIFLYLKGILRRFN